MDFFSSLRRLQVLESPRRGVEAPALKTLTPTSIVAQGPSNSSGPSVPSSEPDIFLVEGLYLRD